MRTYHQYCSVAKALDVVGDRWVLLIVRELLTRGPSRYTDLKDGLPGIASNLLADRLRELERAGLVVRRDAPPPVATTLYALTPRGAALRDVVWALGRWGVGLMADPRPDDVFRTHWLTFPVGEYLHDAAPGEPPIQVGLVVDGEAAHVTVGDGRVSLVLGPADHPVVTVAGPAPALLGLVSGALTVADARDRGLTLEGDPDGLRRAGVVLRD